MPFLKTRIMTTEKFKQQENILKLIESEYTRELGLQQAKVFEIDENHIVSTLLRVGYDVFYFNAGQLTMGGDGTNSTLNNKRIRLGNYLNVVLIRTTEKGEEQLEFNNCSLLLASTLIYDLEN